MVRVLGKPDENVEQAAGALREYEEANAGSECSVYRYNPASIRIKIIDTAFQDRSKGERHDYAMRWLNHLADDVISQISVLLCLAPGESSLLDLEFQDPTHSIL